MKYMYIKKCLLFLLLFFAASPGKATVVLDQQSTAGSTTGWWMASITGQQTFTAGYSGTIYKVAVQTYAPFSTSISLQLYSGTPGSGTLMGSMSYSKAAGVTSWDTLFLPGPGVAVTAGNTYYLQINTPSGVDWIISFSNPYPGGQAYRGGGYPGYDCNFKTFMAIGPCTAPVAGPNQTGVSIGSASAPLGLTDGGEPGYWTSSGTGTFSNRRNPNATYTPSCADGNSTVTLTWTSSCGFATATQTIAVPAAMALNATAAPMDICRGGSSNLNVSVNAPTYCSPVVGFPGYEIFMSSFTLGSLSHASGHDYYADNTSMSVSLTAGTPYPVSISGDYYDQNAAVWIDYNHDGVFAGSEAVYSSYIAPYSTASGSVTVPVTALNGPTRMRVGDDYYIYGNDPCYSNYGDYEDYTVNISGGVPAPGGGPYTYSWTPTTYLTGAGTASPVANNVNATTNYSVLVTDLSTGCNSSASVAVTIHDTAVITVQPVSQNICENGTLNLSVTATNASGYQWAFNGTPISGATSSTYSIAGFQATDAGNYTVTVYDNTPCSGTQVSTTAVVGVTAAPVISVTPSSASICPSDGGSSATLTASGADTYSWAPGGASGATVTVSPSSTTIYTVSGTSTATGCTGYATATVAVGPSSFSLAPTATPGSVCSGSTVTLNANAAGASNVTLGTDDYHDYFGGPWRQGACADYKVEYMYTASELTSAGVYAGNINSITFYATDLGSGGTLGNYTIKIGNAPETSESGTYHTGLATVYGPVGYTSIMGANTFTFAAPFFWDGTSSIVVQVCHDYTCTGSAAVQMTNISSRNIENEGTGCPAVASGVLNNRPVTTFSVPANTYTWNPGALTGSVVNINPVNTGVATATYSYLLTATDPTSGCFDTASVSISVDPGPEVSVSPSSAVICPGSGTTSTTLTASGADTYAWNPGGATGSVQTFSPGATTTYSVVGSNSFGCTDTTDVLVTVGPNTSVTASATPATICEGATSQLDAVVPGASTMITVPGYIFTTNGSASLIPMSSPVEILPSGYDDNASGSNPIGFNFLYEGVSYTTFAASSNGVFGFGGSVTSAFSNFTPSPASALMPYWEDQTTAADGGIYYSLEGTSPNQKLVVEWHTCIYPSYDPYTQTYQVILSESTNTIEFRYGNGTGSSSATAGLAGGTSTDLNLVNTTTHTNTTSSYDINTNWPGNGRSYQFATPSLFNYTWSSGTTLTDSTILNPVATPVSTTAYTITATDIASGCASTAVATVNVNPSGQWLGASSDWNDGTNWCGGVPTASSNIIIPLTGSTPFDPHVFGGNTGDVHNINLQNSSVTVDAGGSLNLYGNVMLSPAGTFDATGGTVNFAGSAPQNILPGFTTSNLIVNGGSNKTLNSNVTVTGNLNLSSGHVILNGNDLILNPGATITGGSASSYVQTTGAGSELVQQIAPVSGSVVFPVGNANYNPAIITNTGTTDNFRVHVRDEVLDGGTSGAQVNAATTYVANHTWDIEEDVIGGSNSSVVLQWGAGEENNPAFDYSHVYVSHYYAGSWHHDGYALAVDAPPATGSNPYTSTLGGLTSFSPFTIGSAGGSTPLPVHLTDVNAVNEGTRNKVEWHSAMEAGLDHYEVERSTDGQSFTYMTSVTATGHAFGYLTYDNNPEEGLTYYRIKMAEQGGSSSYSQVVYAFMKVGDNISITVYPNPASSVLHVDVFGASDKASVVLVDLSGRVISPMSLNNGKAEINTSSLASGTYFVQFTDGQNRQNIKVTKQ